MDEYLNDTFQIIPQLQEKVLFHNDVGEKFMSLRKVLENEAAC